MTSVTFYYVFDILSGMAIRTNSDSNCSTFKSRCVQITRIVAVILNDIKRNENGVDDTVDSIMFSTLKISRLHEKKV